MGAKSEITYEGNPDAVKALQDDFQAIGNQVKDIITVGTVIANNAANNVIREYYSSGLNVRSGGLREGTYPIHNTTESGMELGIGNPMIYSEIQDLGGPKKDTVIIPKKAKALKIPVGGGFIFRKKVTIPKGTIRASGFMTNPFIRSMQNQFDDLFKRIKGKYG